ncbi:S-layer homology domain-containing protein [Paenibacillus sp. PL91]|uniref:S-layer homology domain-containing protein n=1 Tax=Paenibacillus sp. PL91 TaxID=2729538 RepID=UPI001CB8ED77|nr:S-layer homology domain-containing protein [Paenibacillus sp. PL91]
MFNGDSGDPGNSNMPTGFVMFDFAGTVEMKVTYHGDGPLTSAKVWPQAYGIEPTIVGNVITFSVTGDKNIVLEVNDNIYNALHIFANPIDTNIPSKGDANVMYFGPGVHEYSDNPASPNYGIIKRQKIRAHTNGSYMAEMDYIDVPSGTTVYLAPGAIVKAQIRTNPYLNEPNWDKSPIKKDITIRGRGILEMSKWSGDFTDAARAKNPEMPGIVAFYSENVKIEGLVVVNPERQSVNVIGSSNVEIDNIKGFTSMHEGDGIVLVMDNKNVTVKNSFVRTSDDALVTGANSSNILWENNVVASMRVHSLMVNAGNLTGYTAKNIYIINSNAYPGIRGTIGVYSANGLTDNVLFENIEIERTRYGSMLEVYPYQIWNHATGSISNITFKNINYTSNPYDFGSQVGGVSATEFVKNVHFENVKVDGKLVTDSASGNLSIGSYVENVTFNGVPYTGDLTLPTSIVPAHSDSKYYQIYNRKQTGKSLFDDSGTVNYGDGTGYKYQWALENSDGFIRFRNRLTGNYMNIEANNGRIQTGPATGWSADWMPVGSENGFFQLRNRKHALQHIHTQNEYVQSGMVGGGDWTSDQWEFVEQNNYEAEDASLSGGAVVVNDHLNYSGIGFAAGYGSIGATTTFTVNAASAGIYNLDLRYANATGATKTISLYVNGIKLRQISLPSLANWDTWGDKVEKVNLNAGDNTITYKYESGDSGNVSLDYITVTAYNKYEAEDASLSGGAVVVNDHLKYSGTGFVDGYGETGATTTFTVNNSSELTRSYNLDLRYANATGATKTVSLYVNGIKLRQISLPSLANWDTWGDKVETVTLKSGLNTISYKYDDGDSGNVNLDYIILHSTSSNRVTVKPAELEAYWRFNEGSGTTAGDSSGKGNTVTLVNNPTWTNSGKFGGALAFNGGSRAEINPSATLNQTGDETVSFWFKTSQPSNGYYSVIRQDSRFTALQLSGGGKAQVAYWPNGSSSNKSLVFPWTYSDNNWHHYVASYGQAIGLKIYVDGNLVASDATNLGPLPNTTNKIILGAAPWGEAYNGLLDDVRVFNYMLTQDQVTQLLNAEEGLTLTSITTPAEITGVVSGTEKTAEALGLPATTELVTDTGSMNANVTWDVDGSSYDPAVRTQQIFTVNGTVTLPVDVLNPNNVALTTSISVTVLPATTIVAADGVSLNKTAASLSVGATDHLVATVTPTNASNKKVTFTVDNDNVVELSNVIFNADGKTSAAVKALSAGTAKITVETEDGQYKDYYNVTVNDVQVPAEGVSLNKSSSTLIVGAADDLIATVSPADATDKTVTFEVEGNAVTLSTPVFDEVSGTTSVTVSAVSPGHSKVTATTAGGNKAVYEATVVAVPVSVTGVTLNKVSEVLDIGAEHTLTATVNPADAANKNVTFTVEGNAVTVTDAVYDAASGTTSVTVKAVSAGRAKITATTADGGHQAVYNVTVNAVNTGNPGNPGNVAVLTGISLDAASASLEVGKTQAIQVTATYSDGTKENVTGKASYATSDASVIAVSANGIMEAVGKGSAAVTVSYLGKTAVVEVTAKQKESGGGSSTDPIFSDTNSHKWAEVAIEALAKQGIIKGTSATTFEPGKKITRADFVTLLVRALGLKAEISGNFQDVDQDDYYYEAIGIVKDLGIAKGTEEGIFNPRGEISRQDMMVLVARALQAVGKWEPNGSAPDLNSFTDASEISAYAADAVAALVKDGIISGRGEGLISPNATTTRAEVAVIVYRVINKYSGSADPEKP